MYSGPILIIISKHGCTISTPMPSAMYLHSLSLYRLQLQLHWSGFFLRPYLIHCEEREIVTSESRFLFWRSLSCRGVDWFQATIDGGCARLYNEQNLVKVEHNEGPSPRVIIIYLYPVHTRKRILGGIVNDTGISRADTVSKRAALQLRAMPLHTWRHFEKSDGGWT